MSQPCAKASLALLCFCSKHMRQYVAQTARSIHHLEASQHVQEQRDAEELAAAAAQQRKLGAIGKRRAIPAWQA